MITEDDDQTDSEIEAMMAEDMKDFEPKPYRCDCYIPKPFGFGIYQCGNRKMKGRRVCWVHRNKEADLKPKKVRWPRLNAGCRPADGSPR